jgi:KDO2-lipid IV(A) lauroyltransferase
MTSSAASNGLHDKSPLRRSFEQAIILRITVCSAWMARLLPLRLLQIIANGIGALIYRLLAKRRVIAMENLRIILGDRYTERERAQILSFSVRNTAKTMLELLKLPWLSDTQFDRFITVSGAEHLKSAAAAGNGVILITAHFGNWEALPAVVSRCGLHLSVIARDSSNPGTARIINHSRELLGSKVLPRESVRSMLQVLRSGGGLGILPDQHAERGGIMVPFMGHPAITPGGPAALALRTGAAVVPGFARRTPDDRLEIDILPPIEMPATGDSDADILEGTRRINEVIGEQIREHPEQWMWMHRRWRVEAEDAEAGPQ